VSSDSSLRTQTSAGADISVCVAVYRARRPPNIATLAADLIPALAGLRAELRVVLNGISPERAGVPEAASVISFPVNHGVPVAWNRAAEGARGDVLCFCNDDVSLGPGALRALHRALVEHPEAGVVGPVGTRWDIATPRHLEWLSTDGYAAGDLVACDVVSGFLFATRRDVFERAGGFDEAYTPCGFEEVDYCTNVRLRLGLECYAIAGIEQQHEFGISAARPWRRVRYDGRSESLSTIDRRNREYFARKWGATPRDAQAASSER
jgi:GT2 family glycosyltransferase